MTTARPVLPRQQGAPLPGTAKAITIALGHVAAAVIGALGQGATIEQITQAAQQGVNVVRRVQSPRSDP